MFVGYIDPGTGMTVITSGSFIIAGIIGFLGVLMIYLKRFWNFIKNNRGPVIIIVVVLIAVVVCSAVLYMNMNSHTAKMNGRIIIIGYDGMSPDIIEPMMAEGKLPAFARLKEEGSYSRLKTTNPSQTPVAWAAFATGQNPGKTGVFDFIMRDPKDYSLHLSLTDLSSGKPNRPIKTKCFWEYTSEMKIPTVVIDCPDTFPPDKVNGRLLSGMGVPDILGTEGTFSFYTSEKLSGDKATGGNVYHVNRSHLMVMNLQGPRVAPLFGKPDHVKVPFKATLDEEKSSVTIEFQNNKFDLKKGEWSGFKDVSFDVGPFKKAKGIVRFHLIETGPEFKLYASPINFDPRAPFFPISYPEDYSRELADEIGLFYTQGMPMDTWAVNEGVISEGPFVKQMNEVDSERKKMLDLEMKKFKSGILFCYFESSDIVQHMFWRYNDPGHPLYEKHAPKEYRDMIRTWYTKLDSILGEVMSQMKEGDTIFVLSDHGFNTFRRAVNLNSWLIENGYQYLRDPYAVEGGDLLSDVDWSKTRAYAIGFGAIYFNEEGREKLGIVKKGAEEDSLKSEIAKKLSAWVDEKTGKRVMSRVYRKEEIFSGPLYPDTPDLFVGFSIGYRASWQTALGAAPETLIEDNLKKWSGDHLFDPALVPGILFSNRKIESEHPSIYDLTPSILKLAGFSDEKIKQANFDGKPLF